MKGMKETVEKYGIPMAWYTDRAGWAFHTPQAGGAVDKKKLTQVGRALARLGVEHIPAYSPQARGRSERLNRTFQDRLVNELRVAGITTREGANWYPSERFVSNHNARFASSPRDAQSVFMSAIGVDLEQIFCTELTRRVAKDNTVLLARVRLQIPKQPGRATCAGLRVTIRKHLEGHYTIWQGIKCLGSYDAQGRQLETPKSTGTSGAPPAEAINPAANAQAEIVESRPNLAVSTSKLSKRGRDRWLSTGPGLSSL